MPNNSPSPKTFTLNDFTPGIYSRAFGTGAGALPAPQGAAQASGTFRCRPLPGGGLGPMPRASTSFSAPTITGVAGAVYPTVCNGNIIIEGITTGTTWRNKWYKIDYATGTLTDKTGATLNYGLQGAGLTTVYSNFNADESRNPSQPVGTNFAEFNGPTLNSAPTTANPQSVGTAFMSPIKNGITGIVGPSASIVVLTDHGAANEKLVWSRSAGGAGNGAVMAFGPTVPMFLLSRVLVTLAQTEVVPTQFGTNPKNTYIYATMFPEYTIMDSTGAQVILYDMTSLGFGIGAFGSISSGELIIFFKHGGALLIVGDMYNPSLTYLPGVDPTGYKTQMRAIPTKEGLIYYSENRGMMLWNGSNTSQDISQQLENDVFYRATAMYVGENISGVVLDDLVVFTNNYVYDLNNHSWWRIEDPSVFNGAVWDLVENQAIAGYPDNYTSAANQIRVFKSATPCFSWQWQSHPIPETVGRKVDVREVEILAQGPANSTITITFLDQAGANKSVTFTLADTKVRRLRKPVTAQCDSVIMTIAANDPSNTSAPLLFETTVFYRDSNSSPGA